MTNGIEIKIWVLSAEVSDQTGESKIVGVYSSVEKAEAAQNKIKDRRSFYQEFSLDALPLRVRR